MAKKKKFKSGPLSRSFSLAKLAFKGVLETGVEKAKAFGRSEMAKSERMREFLKVQAGQLTKELSELKGSLMKVGQVVSFYGEQFLPPEFNEVLKVLQTKASPLEWSTMEKIYRESLGAEKYALLEIAHEPIGAASLGQVHSAIVKASGEKIALKAQYPGVKKAIDSDLKMLRFLLKAGNWIPFTPALDRVFEEARAVLHQEVDYELEFQLTQKYFDAFARDGRFIVPRPLAQFSGSQVLATTFEEGVPVESEQVMALSQERRNRLGQMFFELFLKEVFEFRFLQSDPHFGNFQIRIDPKGENDKVICFDFGAARSLSEDFLSRYRRLVFALLGDNPEETRKALVQLGFLDEGAEPAQYERLLDLCSVLMEPVLRDEVYDWGKSDLATRSLAQSKYFVFQPEIKLPPTEMITLNRKAGGVYILMAKLGASFNPRPMLDEYLGAPRSI
jgi:predicted unusual protein kinase regulating ubiquinone biosynthesis (AarF/ABC1/UbiB family)